MAVSALPGGSFHPTCLVCRLVLSLSLVGAAVRAQDEAAGADPVLNRRQLARQQPVFPRVFDSHPAFVEDPAPGAGFMAWHSFAPGAERIVGRVLGNRADVPFVDLSAGSGVKTPPEIAASNDGMLVAAWSEWRDGHWQVRARSGRAGNWSAVTAVTAPADDALQPALAVLEGGRTALAWVEWQGAHFEIKWSTLAGGTIATPTRVSDAGTDAFRPQLVTGSRGELHLVWDAYARNAHQIFARQLLPQPGPIETVSSSPDRCLKPAASRSADGTLHVAWVRATDVVGAEGAIDQLHALQVARRGPNGWTLLANEDGSDAAAWLAGGLLAQIEPRPVATGGYMGRRRDPMFLHDGAALWLLWERKASQTGSTSLIAGELLGRRIENGRMGPPVILTRGAVDYRVAHHAQVRDGRFSVLGSTLPRDGMRDYTLTSVALANATPTTTPAWPGWKRIDLPTAEAEPRRHTLREHGREYRLFWMDSHVHSTLSADAEGEPDEILFYARDRGRLDTVVMQENDFYNCPLTDYEYQLGTFFARALSRDGKFVALPGYEWTQRLPTDRALPAAEPRFWGANFPNHRTVIYPRAGGPLIRYTDAGNNVQRLYDVVAKHGGVMHTQHPEFEFTGAPGEVAIEVTAGWGLYFLNPGKIHATLNRGFRAGFVATSDSHRRNPGLGGGLTGIYAAELTPDAILEAYRARRVFATSGSRIAIEARANGVLMGQDVNATGGVKLSLTVNGTRPLRRATLIRNGEDVKVFALSGDSTSAKLDYDEVAPKAGTHWYYWRVEQEGVSKHFGGNVSTAFGHLAWSTPHWVTFMP